MTLEPYDAAKLDRLALRLLDISADLRRISRNAAAAPDLPLALHDRKAVEWIGQLEHWVAECAARAELAALRRKGEKNAQTIVQNIGLKSGKRAGR